jgi:hypothetical protein
MITFPTLRDTLREMHRELTSLLLVGAMLAPFVAAVAGWRVHTPLGVPLLVHGASLLALGLLWFGIAGHADATPSARRSIEWLLVAPAAATFAAIVRERANVFYTERALVEGMAVLLVLHAGASVLRTRTCHPPDRADDDAPSGRGPGAEWRRRIRARCLPTTPAVRLADLLTGAVGWLVLGAWVLIALEHRHAAGPLLLVAGAMQTLAFLALVPDALASAGWLTPRTLGPSAPRD